MKKSYCVLILLFFSLPALAQKTCTEYLQEAQIAFDNGNIHDLAEEYQTTWGNCLPKLEDMIHFKKSDVTNSDMTPEELTQAYRLLTLTYLQLDEPVQADKYMRALLLVSPEYIINDAVDPTEFVNLFNTFRHEPIFRIGIRGGGNTTFRHFQTNTGLVADIINPDKQVPTFGYQIGASVELDLFSGDRTHRFYKRIILNPELMYSSKVLVDNSVDDSRSGDYRYNVQSIELNAIGHYNLSSQTLKPIAGQFQFLVSAGFSTEYRTSVTLIGQNLNVNISDEISESRTLDHTDAFRRLDVGVVVGGAVRFKVGRPSLTLDIRYKYNFTNIRKEAFSNPGDTITFGVPPLDKQRIQLPYFILGVHWPIFKHEKLTEL